MVFGPLGFLRQKLSAWALYRYLCKPTEIEFIDSDNFKYLNEAQVLQILQSDNINIAEIELFDLIMEWYSYNSPEDEVLEHFFELIHFPTMTVPELQKIEKLKIPQLKTSLLLEAYRYIACNKFDKATIPTEFKNVRHKQRGALYWRFDPKYCNRSICIKDKRILYQSSEQRYATVIGNMPLKPNTGIYKWSVKLLSASTYWLAIGVIEKSLLTSNLETDFNNCYGVSSSYQLFRCSGSVGYWYTNDIIQVELNTNTGVLEIINVTRGDTKVTCNALKNKELYPFFNMYSNGNELVLIQQSKIPS